MHVPLILLTLATIGPICAAFTTDNYTSLITFLLRDYDTRVLPQADLGLPVRVYFSFTLGMIQSFNDLTGQLDFLGNFITRWTDKRIRWNPDRWGGIEELVLPKMNVWHPEMIMPSSLNRHNIPGASGTKVRVNYNGTAQYYSHDLLSVSCSLDVSRYPNDIQRCDIFVYPEMYNRKELIITHMSDSRKKLVENNEWEVQSSSQIHEADEFQIIFNLSRRTGYIMITLKAPIQLLGLLNPWVFFLPPDSGERVSLSITAFLSFTVYMGVLTDHIPRASKPIPNVLYEVFINLIYSTAILLCTILSLRLHMHSNEKPVPTWLQRLYRILTCKCFSRKRSSKTEPQPREKEGELYASVSNIRLRRLSSQFVLQQIRQLQRHVDLDGVVEKLSKAEERLPEVTWCKIGYLFDFFCLIMFYILYFTVLIVYEFGSY